MNCERKRNAIPIEWRAGRFDRGEYGRTCMGLVMRHMWTPEPLFGPRCQPHTLSSIFSSIESSDVTHYWCLQINTHRGRLKYVGTGRWTACKRCWRRCRKPFEDLSSRVAFSPALTPVYPSKTFFVRWRLTTEGVSLLSFYTVKSSRTRGHLLCIAWDNTVHSTVYWGGQLIPRFFLPRLRSA